MTRRSPVALTVLAIAAATLLASCGGSSRTGGGPDADATLTVLAAASLTDVFDDLAPVFEDRTGASVTFSYGSSTDLAEQAADGAPGDVLATADLTSMQVAQDAGATGTVTEFAGNVLVVVTPPGNPAGVGSLEDLDGTTWVRCADEVPCGRVALAVLEAAGVDAEPASLEEDVRSTLDKVASGEAEAGLVYATDAVAAGAGVEAVTVPDAQDQPTTYAVAPLAQSDDPDLARAWVELLTSPEGRAALTRAGFTLP